MLYLISLSDLRNMVGKWQQKFNVQSTTKIHIKKASFYVFQILSYKFSAGHINSIFDKICHADHHLVDTTVETSVFIQHIMIWDSRCIHYEEDLCREKIADKYAVHYVRKYSIVGGSYVHRNGWSWLNVYMK